jgi:hypothetical protein
MLNHLGSDDGHDAEAAEVRDCEPSAAAGCPLWPASWMRITEFDRFVTSVIATFGGTASKKGVFTVTPTPSKTMSQLVLTPAGTFSVFGFETPIPYPFGSERTGYLVTDMDSAIRAARVTGADILVSPFNDPIGRDAVIQWPGGVNTQLYWHTTAPSYTSLQLIPENRVYVSAYEVRQKTISVSTRIGCPSKEPRDGVSSFSPMSLSRADGPEPPITRAARQAKYSKLTSPGVQTSLPPQSRR